MFPILDSVKLTFYKYSCIVSSVGVDRPTSERGTEVNIHEEWQLLRQSIYKQLVKKYFYRLVAYTKNNKDFCFCFRSLERRSDQILFGTRALCRLPYRKISVSRLNARVRVHIFPKPDTERFAASMANKTPPRRKCLRTSYLVTLSIVYSLKLSFQTTVQTTTFLFLGISSSSFVFVIHFCLLSKSIPVSDLSLSDQVRHCQKARIFTPPNILSYGEP